MTREALAQAPPPLPPEEAAALLRALLDRQPADAPPMDEWLRTVDRVSERRRTLLRRLADR